MPQGGIDEGEEPRAAAARELREETGVVSAELISEAPGWLCYDFPPAIKEKITRLWGKAVDGQAQRWYLFRFTGTDDEIKLTGDGSEAPEFAEWRWVPMGEVIEQAVDFKRGVYQEALRVFAAILGMQL
eukprot:SM000091S24627  [mRNA]  locus=s91:405750:407076:+ [translate_table: standard]